MTFGSFVTIADTNTSAINAGYIDGLWRTATNHDAMTRLNEEVHVSRKANGRHSGSRLG